MSTLVPVDPAMTESATLKLPFSGNRVVSRTPLFRPRQADPGGDPRAGGFRTALATLFPMAPNVSPGPRGLLRRRPVRVAIEILAVLVAAVAMLLRVGHIPVGAEILCHQVIFVDDATCAVMPLDPGVIQVGDAIWQRLQWRGLV